MRIIEALKRIKHNKEKITDLNTKIAQHCANLSIETPVYGTNQQAKIQEWLQSCTDLSQENVKLLVAVQRTNLQTPVTIEIAGKAVTKTIAEWVWRRREYAKYDELTWSRLTDRGLREGNMKSSTDQPVEVKIVRHFDPAKRDEQIAMYRAEPHLIDSALEIVNATTDLIEK